MSLFHFFRPQLFKIIKKHLFQRIPSGTFPPHWLKVGLEEQASDPLSIEIKNLTNALDVIYMAFRDSKKNGNYAIGIDLGFREDDVHFFSENRDENGWVIIDNKGKIVDFSRDLFCKLMFSFLPSFENENWDRFAMRIYVYDDAPALGGIYVYGGGFYKNDLEGAIIEKHSDLLPFTKNESSDLDDLLDYLRRPEGVWSPGDEDPEDEDD